MEKVACLGNRGVGMGNGWRGRLACLRSRYPWPLSPVDSRGMGGNRAIGVAEDSVGRRRGRLLTIWEVGMLEWVDSLGRRHKGL